MTATPWFELLSKNKLLAHLASESPDPEAAELIVKLIAYAPRPSPAAGGDVELVSPSEERRSAVWQSLQQSARSARRVAGLQYKLLAVQVFAHLGWRFTALDNQVPLPLQQTLLSTLLSVSGRALADVSCHSEMDLAHISPQAVFAITLYHRWVLWTVCQLALPRRPPRAVTVPLPGQQDPAVVMPHVVDAARQQAESLAPTSLALLTRLTTLLPETLLPTPDCFTAYTEAVPEPTHKWARAERVTADELLCQLSFELGRYHFFKARYVDAGRCFAACDRLYQTAPWRRTSHFVWLNPAELAGYCLALNVQTSPPPQPSLYHRLRVCVAHQYQGVVQVLQEDNRRRELPLSTRDTLARDVEAIAARRDGTVPPDLAHKIEILNCVRRALEGRHQTVTLSTHLTNDAKLVVFLLDCVQEAVSSAESSADPAAALGRLRLLLLRTGQHAPALVPALAVHPAGAALYTAQELDELRRLHEEPEEGLWADEPATSLAVGVRDPAVEAGALERQLMESYSPAVLRRALQQLAALQPKRALWRCNTRWELPIPVQGVIMSLPAGFGRDFFYIMMAKAKELLALKRFDGSRGLLQTILEEARSAQLGAAGLKLARLIGWEKLLADLLQLLHNWPKLGDYHELTPRAKSCLSALQTGSDVLPRSELLEHCTLYLLNVCEWDHLSELERRWPQVDLAALLATVCRELVNKGNNRKMSRDLWNAVIPMFTVSGQQKRNAMGAASSVQRDSPHAIMPRTQLTQFIQKVHEHTSLSVLTSLLTRLHNILLDDTTREMSLEHAVLWPNVVNDPKLFSLKNVSECLQTLLEQGIRLYPSHIPWLQAMADLRYAGDEPTSSLRYYLEACLVSSEYFTRPVPRTVLSEAVLRRMIKCCSMLHCYTQAAVLCQFQEDVDYASAFQYVAERSCADAMDGYYDCIWDMTLLEYLTHLHHKRSERCKRQQVIKLIGQLELNSNNNEEIQREAATVRKARFLRAMVKQYAA